MTVATGENTDVICKQQLKIKQFYNVQASFTTTTIKVLLFSINSESFGVGESSGTTLVCGEPSFWTRVRPPCPLLNLIGPGVFLIPIYGIMLALFLLCRPNKTEMIMKSPERLSGLDEGAVDL